MDQIAARQLGQHTQLASLELGLETSGLAGACDVGYSCAYVNTLCWRSPTTPLPMETNPRAVFERLFGGSDSTDAAARVARVAKERSILDSVTERVRELERGAAAGALVEQVRADRGDAAERAVLAAPDGALRRLMREANACVGRCIDILSDNRVSDAERLEALRMLAGLEETLTRTRLALIQAERTGGSR